MPIKKEKTPIITTMPSGPEDPTQSRIQSLKAREASERADLKFSTVQDKDNDGCFTLKHEVINNDENTTSSENEIAYASYSALSGSSDSSYSRLFISLATSAMSAHIPTEKSSTLAINAFQGAMLSMNPKDIIEAQLCSKLVILHTQAMNFVNRAATATYQKSVDQNLNNATKFMRLHNETVEALNRYRRKGEQRVKVVHQYVQVNEGGQAVVVAEARGGDKQKKHRCSPCQ